MKRSWRCSKRSANQNRPLFKSLRYYIKNRTYKAPIRHFPGMASSLLDEYPKLLASKQRTVVRSLLSILIPYQSKAMVQKFFYLMIRSENSYERNAANKVVDLLWKDDPDIKNVLLQNFKKYHDEASLRPLVDNMSPDELARVLETYWAASFPSLKPKFKLIQKLKDVREMSVTGFITEKDLMFYVQLPAMKGLSIPPTNIEQLSEADWKKNHMYLIWALGLSRDFDQLKKLLTQLHLEKHPEQFDKNSRDIRKEFTFSYKPGEEENGNNPSLN